MILFLAVIQRTVGLFLDVLQFMMFARAITSWIPSLAESAVGEFLFTVTEWVIAPVRAIFDKLGFGGNMIIDIPFFVTFILISVIRVFI